MEIKYLTQVIENPKLDGFVNRGLSMEKIEELEKKYNDGKEFPMVLREYLFLAGDFNNFAFDDIDGVDYIQERARFWLDKAGTSIGRPFFVFDQLSDCDSFVFIYLDEGIENPKTYVCLPYFDPRNEDFIKHNGWDFTALVNESIRRVKYNIAF